MKQGILALRMQRQHLGCPADEAEYLSLFRDLQPGLNVYWNGFGQPPCLSFRAAFDDLAFNAERQNRRELVKGRFCGGNLGWILPEDWALFAALYRKPLKNPSEAQLRLWELIQREGPLTIQQMKEETGLLVKEITPALHKLQEAYLIYEDQYDGEWDRGWYVFIQMFPDVNLEQYTRQQALQILLSRYAYRMVWFDAAMAKGWCRLPEKDICAAAEALCEAGSLVRHKNGYLWAADASALEHDTEPQRGIYALHRNDVLYKSQEAAIKAKFQPLLDGLDYDHEILQAILIDGAFRAVVAGHFRNGPYDLNDVVLDDPALFERKDEILEAVRAVNFGKSPVRFGGEGI